jgi:hypothetical protein
MRKFRSFVFKPFRKTTQWIVFFWNLVSGFINCEVFHFPFVSAVFFQVVAFLIEYAVSAFYQRLVLRYDKRIVCYSRIKHIPKAISYLMRYASFLILYWCIFLSTFMARLWVISLPTVATWIKDFTMWLFGVAVQMDLFTRDLNKTIIVACVASFFIALAIPLSLIAKRTFLRKLSKWKFRGKLSKKQHNKKNGKR